MAKETPPGPKLRISRANKLTAEELARRVDAAAISGLTSHDVTVLSAPFSESDREEIWTIFEVNMRSLYERSDMGWKPSKKKRELFNVDSKFVAVRARGVTPDAAGEMLAYVMWRFDGEDNDEGVKQAVAYLYELSVAPAAQGRKLGTSLIDALRVLGSTAGMSKIMLTVFKANTAALEFYRKVGFQVDAISPSRCVELGETDESDYEILSLYLDP